MNVLGTLGMLIGGFYNVHADPRYFTQNALELLL